MKQRLYQSSQTQNNFIEIVAYNKSTVNVEKKKNVRGQLMVMNAWT